VPGRHLHQEDVGAAKRGGGLADVVRGVLGAGDQYGQGKGRDEGVVLRQVSIRKAQLTTPEMDPLEALVVVDARAAGESVGIAAEAAA
jgi:hypothetical protein